MKDALGNKIFAGLIYGHAVRTSGKIDVVVGEAVRIDEKTVTLEIMKRGSAYYENDITEGTIKRKLVSIIPNGLFPIMNGDIKWQTKN